MIAGRIAATAVQRQVRHISPVPPAAATGLVAAVYTQVAEEMRLVIPPALMHSPAPRALAAYWMLLREPVLVGDIADRALKEAAAAAVSVATICPYCVDMHSASMYELTGEHDAERLATDHVDDMVDPHVREVSEWARTAHDVAAARPLPSWLGPVQRTDLIGTVLSLHYLARMVNVFLANFLLPPRVTGPARRRLKQGLGRLLRPTLHAQREPGRSLALLPTAVLPADASWAHYNPWVAGAVAQAAATFEAAGQRWLSPELRAVVNGYVDQWRGEESGMSTAWCDDVLAGLGPADRAVGRLVLLTAVSSHQIGDETVAGFREHLPGDEALVEVAGWAAFEAARRIAARQQFATDGARKETRPPAIS